MAIAARKAEPEELLTLPLDEPTDDVTFAPGADDNEPPAQEDEVTALKRQIELLTKQTEEKAREVDRERQQRLENERRLAEAQRQQSEEATNRLTAEEAAIANAIAAATAEADNAEREYASAMERGDYAAAAKAQRQISGAEADLKLLKRQQDDFTDNKRKVTERQQRQQNDNPLDNYPPRTRAWIEKNPDFLVPGSRVNTLAMAAHYDAISQGIAPESEEYFDHINERVNQRQARRTADDGAAGEDMDANDNNARTARRPTATRQPAAPPSRGTQTQRPADNGREMRLSAEEKAMALAAKDTLANHPGEMLSDAEALRRYAENKAEIQRQERGAY